MSKGNVVEIRKPAGVFDPLIEAIRQGTKKMLIQAVETEMDAFGAKYASVSLADGQRRVARNGYLPEREIKAGIGPVAVCLLRIRDKEATSQDKIRFTSKIVPPFLRRTKSIEELIPWLYLKGISTGDFSQSLAALLGPDAPGFSASTVSRLKDEMSETKKEAEKAFDYFFDVYRAKYPKAATCLSKDREELLAFYDFPAEHWKHIRTTNPIEATLATVRLRTNKSGVTYPGKSC
jgi:transposase-like protein